MESGRNKISLMVAVAILLTAGYGARALEVQGGLSRGQTVAPLENVLQVPLVEFAQHYQWPCAPDPDQTVEQTAGNLSRFRVVDQPQLAYFDAGLLTRQDRGYIKERASIQDRGYIEERVSVQDRGYIEQRAAIEQRANQAGRLEATNLESRVTLNFFGNSRFREISPAAEAIPG